MKFTKDIHIDVRDQADANEYRKTATIHAMQVDEPFTVENNAGLLQGKPGDFVAQNPDDPTDQWVIEQDKFEAMYEPVPAA